ncbi:MAG TPA: DsrE family protein [Chitinophagaceae bacterium]|nr:DsrE family protein [Chitinophagaceae bacterium]
MKKIIVLLLLVNGIAISIKAQTKQHKVVFEITSADTADHRTVLRQINNVIKDAPGTNIEVVCHGPAIFMLVKEKTMLAAEMQELKSRYGVDFAACANSMKKNNLDKSQLVTSAMVVPNGVMEVVKKEEEGWSYIKAGG